MDSQQRRRSLNRQRTNEARSKTDYGSRQICIEMDRETYDDIWDDPRKVRSYVEDQIAQHPELFPEDIADGFVLSGMLRESKKMPGIQLRQLRIGKTAYALRPSFVMPWFTGTTDELEKPLLLMSYGVPSWLITEVFGRNEMFWYRQVARLGRNSVVGTTINDPASLPKHLAADEHHAKWQGEKGYVATTAAQGCLLGVALTDEADVTHLQEAYGVFAEEARELSADYQPQTVNTDGWWATQNAFKALFPQIVVILCYLHGFLKIRDRCYKDHELHEKIWNVYHADHIRMFDQRMKAFKKWFEERSWSKAVSDMTAKLWKRAKQYRIAYKHPDCYRTSNQVDRPMNRMTRCMYASRGIHGHQHTSELRLRGWALLHNFRPFAKRAGKTREFQSPAHRINRNRYHENWLTNLMLSASMGGKKNVHSKR